MISPRKSTSTPFDYGLLPDTFLLSGVLQAASPPQGPLQEHLSLRDNRLLQLPGSSQLQIPEDSHWKLIYFRRSGWHEPVPSYQTTYDQFFSASVDTIHSGADLADLFPLANDSLPWSTLLTTLPLFLSPGHPTNGQWVARRLQPNWLLIQRINSYPHGSQTSWYREERYYFVREN